MSQNEFAQQDIIEKLDEIKPQLEKRNTRFNNELTQMTKQHIQLMQMAMIKQQMFMASANG